jgi:hypothetical protein
MLEMENLPKEYTSNSQTCPYLGKKKDRTVRYGYPHESNYCYKSNNEQPVSLSYQEQTCIHHAYWKCPVYSPAWTGPFPQNIRRQSVIRNEKLYNIFSLIMIILLLLLLVCAAYVVYMLIRFPEVILP